MSDAAVYTVLPIVNEPCRAGDGRLVLGIGYDFCPQSVAEPRVPPWASRTVASLCPRRVRGSILPGLELDPWLLTSVILADSGGREAGWARSGPRFFDVWKGRRRDAAWFPGRSWRVRGPDPADLPGVAPSAATSATATSATAPAEAPDAYLHDGFYFRLSLGLSYVRIMGTSPSGTGSATFGGPGLGYALAVARVGRDDRQIPAQGRRCPQAKSPGVREGEGLESKAGPRVRELIAVTHRTVRNMNLRPCCTRGPS
jgi:hypothetical protein